MKKTEKNFDALAFQRKRRRELSNLYNTDKAEFESLLAGIRKKYRFPAAKKKHTRPHPLAKA